MLLVVMGFAQRVRLGRAGRRASRVDIAWVLGETAAFALFRVGGDGVDGWVPTTSVSLLAVGAASREHVMGGVLPRV